MQLKLGIAGATGAVGRMICSILPDSKLAASEFHFLASPRSAGTRIAMGGSEYPVERLSRSSINGLDLLIASTPDEVARELGSWCREAGVTMIDESGAWRMDDEVPLVVPEVNPETLNQHRGLIASPNCSTTQMVVCLKPIQDLAGIRRVTVSTYQAASGAGAAAERELIEQSRSMLDGESPKPHCFSRPLPFNAIPRIGRALASGYTSEEVKMVAETQKILGAPDLHISATCVRVPVVRGHSESVTVECAMTVDADQIRDCLREAAGITVIDDLADDRYPVPTDCTGRDDVLVGRIRQDLVDPRCIHFWCVSDNLRKGAATNAVQIAEELIDREMIRA